MARLDENAPPLTAYERAACYYSLPRVAPPLPAAFVFLYGGSLLLLLGVLCLVSVYASSKATYAMVVVVMLVALGGTIAVMARAMLAEIRTRQILRDAHTAPSTMTQDDSLPDPFADHVLLRHPGDPIGRLTACTTGDLEIEYFLDNTDEHGTMAVRTPQDETMLTVRSTGGAGSFTFVPAQARRYGVFVNDSEVARVEDGGTLLRPQTNIICHTPIERTYAVRDGGIFLNDTLVGRVYFVHDAHYLDIAKEHLNEGTLGYFVSLI